MAYNPDCIYCQVVIDKEGNETNKNAHLLLLLDAIVGHPRATTTGGGCPQPALPEQEETRARGFWTQEGH